LVSGPLSASTTPGEKDTIGKTPAVPGRVGDDIATDFSRPAGGEVGGYLRNAGSVAAAVEMPGLIARPSTCSKNQTFLHGEHLHSNIVDSMYSLQGHTSSSSDMTRPDIRTTADISSFFLDAKSDLIIL
jgi:hypothetical protein